MRLRVGEQKIWKWETVVEGRERELNWGLSDLLLVSNVQSSVRACAFKHDVWTGCSPSWNKNSSNDSLPLNPPRQEHPNNWMLNCPRVPKTSMDSSNVVNTSLSYVNSVTTAVSQNDKLFDEAKSFVCLWDRGKKCKWITYNEEVCTLVWKMKHSEKKIRLWSMATEGSHAFVHSVMQSSRCHSSMWPLTLVTLMGCNHEVEVSYLSVSIAVEALGDGLSRPTRLVDNLEYWTPLTTLSTTLIFPTAPPFEV